MEYFDYRRFLLVEDFLPLHLLLQDFHRIFLVLYEIDLIKVFDLMMEVKMGIMKDHQLDHDRR
jgi:hypothetical protein